MQLSQQRDQPLRANGLILGVQFLTSTQLFQHVVHTSQGQLRELRLLTLPMGIDFLRFGADLVLLLWRRVGEREGLEATGLVIARVIANAETTTSGQSPSNMHAAGKHAENCRIVAGDIDQHVIGQNGGIEELEYPMLGGFDSGNVTSQSCKLLSQFLPRLTEQPPERGIPCSILGISLGLPFRLYSFKQQLIHGREARAHLVGRQPEQIDHHNSAW